LNKKDFNRILMNKLLTSFDIKNDGAGSGNLHLGKRKLSYKGFKILFDSQPISKGVCSKYI